MKLNYQDFLFIYSLYKQGHWNMNVDCYCFLWDFPTRLFDTFMYCLFVFSKSSLLPAMPAGLFDFFVYFPFVFNRISSWCCLMIALPARIFDSFMYCPFALSKISFPHYFMVTLPAKILDSFMYFPFVFSKISVLSELLPTLPARVFDSCIALLCSERWPLDVAWWQSCKKIIFARYLDFQLKNVRSKYLVPFVSIKA